MPRNSPPKLKVKVYEWPSVGWTITRIANTLAWNPQDWPGVFGQPRGGLVLAVGLSHVMDLPLLQSPQPGCLWVDDIVDTGATLKAAQDATPNMTVAAMVVSHPFKHVLHGYEKTEHTWVVFPWEVKANAQQDAAARTKLLAQRNDAL